MIKYIFKDGYIEINNQGNTYLGNIAHELMHKAEEITRETQKEPGHAVKVDFNEVLILLIESIKKRETSCV